MEVMERWEVRLEGGRESKGGFEGWCGLTMKRGDGARYGSKEGGRGGRDGCLTGWRVEGCLWLAALGAYLWLAQANHTPS